MPTYTESDACNAVPLSAGEFNPDASLPYGCRPGHAAQAMEAFCDFLSFVNRQLHSRGLERLESMLMPANFSSIVGEFMGANIPRFCPTLVRNRYHNGHPDLIPAGRFPNDEAQHSHEGMEVKGSRYARGWQGHNLENVWLMVFVFDSSRPDDARRGVAPVPFRFRAVLAAELEETDWRFSGRSNTSRRTITASVTETGRAKMIANWVYREVDVAGLHDFE